MIKSKPISILLFKFLSEILKVCPVQNTFYKHVLCQKLSNLFVVHSVYSSFSTGHIIRKLQKFKKTKTQNNSKMLCLILGAYGGFTKRFQTPLKSSQDARAVHEVLTPKVSYPCGRLYPGWIPRARSRGGLK